MSSINPKKIKHRSPYNYMGIQFYDLKALMQGEENCQKEIDKQIRRLKRKKLIFSIVLHICRKLSTSM